MTLTRDGYGALSLQQIPADAAQQVRDLVNAAGSADHIDEHGSWNFGIVSDRKGRWSALNWDLYAFGTDYHSGQFLAVIQVREAVKGRRFTNVRKSYFLLGRNEDNSVFAHPVEARVIHHAIRVGDDVILRVQDWIFQGEYRRMVRHGDLALIPVTRAVGERTGRKTMLLQKSHKLNASIIRTTDNAVYAKNPSLKHTPGVHPDVSKEGWYRIQVGNRARFHAFAAPTID